MNDPPPPPRPRRPTPAERAEYTILLEAGYSQEEAQSILASRRINEPPPKPTSSPPIGDDPPSPPRLTLLHALAQRAAPYSSALARVQRRHAHQRRQ